MSRCIDADALEELFREVIGGIAKKPEMNGNLEHMVRASAMVIEMIQDAPTIEQERKKGHWVGAREYCNHLNDEAKREGRTEKYMPSGMVIGVYCDQCWAINTKRGNYCSNCGARMEGES